MQFAAQNSALAQCFHSNICACVPHTDWHGGVGLHICARVHKRNLTRLTHVNTHIQTQIERQLMLGMTESSCQALDKQEYGRACLDEYSDGGQVCTCINTNVSIIMIHLTFDNKLYSDHGQVYTCIGTSVRTCACT